MALITKKPLLPGIGAFLDGSVPVPCYDPISGFICQDGKFRTYAGRDPDARPQVIPCGQCVGCRLERSRQWAVRCMHEASLWKRNSFITLTYNDAHLPDDKSLHYEHFQKFMKRLRFNYTGHQSVTTYDKVKGHDVTSWPIRFYMAGEYGENFGRPHFHACIFNFDFDDKKPWQKSPSGSLIYRSKKLEDLWSDPLTGESYGFSSIGEVNFQSAAYVARYIMKKVTGQISEKHYTFIDPSTGEIHNRRPEFNKMSLKPGIGALWYDKFKSDVYPHDYVVINGKQVKPPRFYDKKFKEEYPVEFDMIEFERYQKSMLNIDDNTPERLHVKEQCVKAKLSLLKRKID